VKQSCVKASSAFLFFLLTVFLGCRVVSAGERMFYVKKDTWQESMRVSRVALMKFQAEQAERSRKTGIELGPWYWVGPFEEKEVDAYSAVYGPEVNTDLKASYENGKLKWVCKPEWVDGEIHKFAANSGRVANYLFRIIKASKAATVPVYLGSNDGIQVWLNGKKVLARDIGRQIEPDQERVELACKEGENKLLMKIDNRGGEHAFYFSLYGGAGASSRIREALWEYIKADFADGQSQAQIQWEQDDNIWEKDWKGEGFGELAERYAAASSVVSSVSEKAKELAKSVDSSGGLEQVRALYYLSKKYDEQIRAIRKKTKLMVSEIDYLKDNYGGGDKKWAEYKVKVGRWVGRGKRAIKRALEGDSRALERLGQVEMQLDKIHNSIPLRLPSGPVGAGRFGAYYTKLRYSLDWDKVWRVGDYADVIVRFDEFDHRFVFWRGTSYIPCWATYDGAWYTNEFFERRGGPQSGTNSMCEPMSDKQARYSRVRIVESNDARVVIHWRYSPVDLDYHQPYPDPLTGWGDWADEYYTIYPDSVGVRSATLHTSALEDWIEYQESIVINQPGSMPEDNMDYGAVTLANLQGESKTYVWTEKGGPRLSNQPQGACIQVINFKSKYKPFSIVTPEGCKIGSYGGHGQGSHFNWWSHWPVAQERSDTTAATSASKPSHSSLSHLEWKPYAKDKNSVTWIMLHGMSDRTPKELAVLAKSWLSPAKLGLVSGDYEGGEYDQAQRAYILRHRGNGKASDLKFELTGSKDSPIVNPAFVIRDWGAAEARLRVNGKEIERGKDFRFGHRKSLESDDLIVWIKTESAKALKITLIPVMDK